MMYLLSPDRGGFLTMLLTPDDVRRIQQGDCVFADERHLNGLAFRSASVGFARDHAHAQAIIDEVAKVGGIDVEYRDGNELKRADPANVKIVKCAGCKGDRMPHELTHDKCGRCWYELAQRLQTQRN